MEPNSILGNFLLLYLGDIGERPIEVSKCFQDVNLTVLKKDKTFECTQTQEVPQEVLEIGLIFHFMVIFIFRL